jgi:hypothetical protein
VEIVQVTRRQSQFLCACPPLDLALPPGGGDAIRVFFEEDDITGPEYAGGSTAFAVGVLDVSAWWIVGVADIETTVVHLEDIDVEGHGERG